MLFGNEAIAMKTKTNSLLRAARHFIGAVVCAGAVLLMASSAQAQNLFVAGFFNGDIYEITPGGAQSTFASGLTYPIGLAFDSAGNLFEGDGQGAKINKFTPSGTQSTFATGLNSIYGLAFNSAGDLFAADYGAGTGDGKIYEFTPSGTRSTFASGLNGPVGLAFNSDDDLFATEPLSGNIYEFTTNGVRSTFASGLSDPLGLAFNSAGDLFVVNRDRSGSSSIYEFTPGGVQSTFVSGLDYYAWVLAFNSAGDLFVADSGNIIEITPDGTQSTFASGIGSEGLAFQPRPELAAIVTNGGFQVAVSMPSPYRSTIIQVSTDMVNWTSVFTNTPPFTFTDSMATTLPCRFYRALLAP
jgi:hypothetical protein